MKQDSIMRQVLIHGREETAIAAHWVTDGVDRYRVGFLEREFVQEAEKYNGKLVQVVEFLYERNDPDNVAFSNGNTGVTKGILIDSISDED